MNIKRTINTLLSKIFSFKIIRYIFNGGILFIIDFSIFYSLTKFLGFDIRISQMISRTSAAIIGFFTHKFFVFKHMEKKLLTLSYQGIAYIALIILNIFLSAGLVYFFIKIIHIDNLLIAKILNETIMVIETFIMLNIIFHKKKSTETKEPKINDEFNETDK